MAGADRRTPTEGMEDMDVIDETIGFAAVDYDLRMRAQELETRELDLKARYEALENAERYAEVMRRARLEPAEEHSEPSFQGFRPGNEDQQMQSTRIEEDARRTTTRPVGENQRRRSRERNTRPDESGNPTVPNQTPYYPAYPT